MIKNLYFPEQIMDFSFDEFKSVFLDAKNNNDITGVNIIIHSYGGYVTEGARILDFFAMNSFFIKKVIISGMCASMAAIIALSFPPEKLEMTEYSTVLLHKAVIGATNKDVSGDIFRLNENLKELNLRFLENLKSKLVDENSFKDVTNFTLEDVFLGEKQIDIYLSAEQVLKLGFIKKITAARIASASFVANSMPIIEKTTMDLLKPNNNIIMTKDEELAFRAEVRVQVLQEQEVNRKSWLPFLEVDKELVTAKIAEGAVITEAERSELLARKTELLVKASLAKEKELNRLEAATAGVQNIPNGDQNKRGDGDTIFPGMTIEQFIKL